MQKRKNNKLLAGIFAMAVSAVIFTLSGSAVSAAEADGTGIVEEAASDFEYSAKSDGTIEITAYSGEDTVVVIPDYTATQIAAGGMSIVVL